MGQGSQWHGVVESRPPDPSSSSETKAEAVKKRKRGSWVNSWQRHSLRVARAGAGSSPPAREWLLHLSPRLEPIPWKGDEQGREHGSFVRGGSSASGFGRVSSLEGCASGDQVPLDTSHACLSKAMDTWRHGNNTQHTTQRSFGLACFHDTFGMELDAHGI